MKGKILLFILGLSVFLQAVSGNLAVYDIRREYVRLATRDGNQEVLNGYASWVYYEEILDRNTKYQVFWLKYLLGKELSE